MSEYAAPPSKEERLFAFEDFMGLRNNTSPETFAPGDMVTATNVDIDDALNLRRRAGYSAVVAAGITRDLWASGPVCLGVSSGNALTRLLPDYSTVVLRSGLTAGASLSYADVGDRVFYANGFESGVVQDGASRSWGLAVPGIPEVATTGGTLTPGIYQALLTYLRTDGQESGAGRAVTIELTADGGIDFTALPVSTDPTVAFKAVYLTAPNGMTLYRYGLIPNADTAFVIREPRMGASPLPTQFMSGPPAGEVIGYFRGYMLVAAGNRLYPSEPYAPELFDLRKSIPFAARITMVAPVLGGVWVGTDTQIIWLAGESPETWTYRVAAEYGVISRAFTFTDSELVLDMPKGDRVAMFAAAQGLCVGTATGGLINLTQARYAFPARDRGAAVVRRHRGSVQLLMTLQGTAQAANVS